MSETYLTPAEVSQRYGGRITTKTLSNWRCPSAKGDGPGYIKLGGRILYPLAGLLRWEELRTRMAPPTTIRNEQPRSSAAA